MDAFKWLSLENFLIIWNASDEGVSIADAMDGILKSISGNFCLKDKIILYQDSAMLYARALIDKNGDFYGYETPLNSTLLIQVGKLALNRLGSIINQGGKINGRK